MQNTFKYIAIIFICVLVLIIYFDFRKTGGTKEVVIKTPDDTSFVPTQNESYRPKVIKYNLKTVLPKNVKPNNVKRIITLQISGVPKGSLDIIETKDDEIYLKKDSAIRLVKITKFEPPAVSFDFKWGIGGSIAYRNKNLNLSPSLVLYPIEIYGIAYVPGLMMDIEGIGICAALKYKCLTIAPVYHLTFAEINKSVKLTINYIIN